MFCNQRRRHVTHLWLHITVNNPVRAHQLQRGKDLHGHATNQDGGEAGKRVGLD
jgi:hypothetical protein